MAAMKDEAAAYVIAVNAKTSFLKEVSPNDFHPEMLAGALRRLDKLRRDLDTASEKITTEELLAEMGQTQKELKAYLAVLSNLADLATQHPELWPALRYLLAPTEEVDPPPSAQLTEARKLLDRICAFSDLSHTLLQQNVARRDTFEKEKALRLQQAAEETKRQARAAKAALAAQAKAAQEAANPPGLMGKLLGKLGLRP